MAYKMLNNEKVGVAIGIGLTVIYKEKILSHLVNNMLCISVNIYSSRSST